MLTYHLHIVLYTVLQQQSRDIAVLWLNIFVCCMYFFLFIHSQIIADIKRLSKFNGVFKFSKRWCSFCVMSYKTQDVEHNSK